MSSTLLTPSLIAREALMQLENNLVMGNLVYRSYEGEYTSLSEGNKKGATITIRKPVRYKLRSGAVASMQDTVEQSTTITVDQQQGVDLQFNSSDMTLKIADFSERYIKPAVSQIANKVDQDLFALYKQVPNWVGTPGNTISTIAGYNAAPQRMTELAVPEDQRQSVLAPADYFGMVNSFSTLFAKQGATAETAIRKAALGTISDVDTYKAQNVATHTTGSRSNTTPLVNGNSQTTTGSATASANTMSFNIKGLANGATIKAGDIFTIANVNAVNFVSKSVQGFLRQFAVTADATADGSGNVTVTITPAIILTGDPYQTVDAAPVDGAAITWLGSASSNYRQSLFFHKSAFALCMVPMEKPIGNVLQARETSKNGLSIRLVGNFDIVNDNNLWRLDVLYGVKALYPEMAFRASGA